MNKKLLSIISIVLVVCTLAVCVPFSANAAAKEHFTSVQSGTQTTLAHNWFVPLSAWKTTTGVCCANTEKIIQPYEIQLREMYIGNAAYNFTKTNYKYATAPAADEQWLVFKYNIKNKSSYTIDVSDILWSTMGFYNIAGDEIDVVDSAGFNNDTVKSIYYVDIPAGQSADVWHAILLKKSDGFPIIQVPHTATESGAQYWTYLYTTPSDAGVPLPAAPTQSQVYAQLVESLKLIGNQFKLESDTATAKVVYTLDLDPATNNITITLFLDDKGATDPDGTFQTVITPSMSGSYPFTMTGNYIDVGRVMSIKGYIPSRLDGNFGFYGYDGTDQFHKDDLMEAAVEFAEAAINTLLDYMREIINKDYTLSMLGFDSKFLCPTGHNSVSMRYNNDATDVSEGTRTGICYDCHERYTMAALGTQTASPQIQDSSLVFKDVKNKWYKNAINYAYSNNFISGMEKDLFGINTSITRGMFITILARIAGVDTSKAANKVTSRFTDVASGKYYANAVKWGYEHGIVSGTSSTKFSPESQITREQLCVMIVNFANAYDVELESKVAEITFADSNKIAGWSYIAVVKCQKAGIVSGYPVGNGYQFQPKKTATRAEAAQILYVFHNEFVFKK